MIFPSEKGRMGGEKGLNTISFFAERLTLEELERHYFGLVFEKRSDLKILSQLNNGWWV